MALVSLASSSEHRDYLELQSDEFSLLFNSMLINVAGFSRDPLAWHTPRDKVLSELLSAKGAKSPIRVTDLDEDALRQARTGSYETRAIADAPDRLRDAYFAPSRIKHTFRQNLRRQVIFGRVMT